MKIIELILSALTVLTPIFMATLWHRLKGYRMQILNFLTVVIAGLTIVSDKIIPFLAEFIHLETATIQSIVFGLLALFNGWLRTITDTPVGKIGDLPQRLTADYQSAIQKLKK